MSYFVDFRERDVGGSVVPPRVFDIGWQADPMTLNLVGDVQAAGLVAGKNVILATHGFNVSRPNGARALGRLEQFLRGPQPGAFGSPAGPPALGSADIFFGVLWPGDFWIPAINYPFEGSDATACGKMLADYCAKTLGAAQSFSFMSHSLGARVVLEAAKALGRRARLVCVMAGAVQNDCLTADYAGAMANADAFAVLASHGDDVLKIAFQIGDPISDILHHDHPFFEPALGYAGPVLPAPDPLAPPWQIADAAAYAHGDYLPPSDAAIPPAAPGAAPPKWQQPAAFLARALKGERQIWP